MSANQVSSGKTFTVTAPEALDSGEYTLVGNIGGVAVSSYDSGDTEAVLDGTGVFSLPKETSLEIAVGDKVYWDTSSKKVDKTAANARLIGVCTKAAGSSDETVEVFIHPAFPASREGAQGDAVADITSSNLTGVDGAGSNAAPLAGTETRLDAIETAFNALLAELRVAGVIAAS